MPMNEFLNFFEGLTTGAVAVKLILATLLGSFVGMERANKRYAAGIRTFALVSLGSALATITGIYFAQMSGDAADIGRVPAQILAGIGFLGAGTIIVTDRRQIRGLTTAAGLWVTAAMGIAIGAGLLWPAVICFCLILITNYYLHYMTQYVENHTRVVDLYVELEKTQIKTLLAFIKEEGYELLSVERRPEVPLVDGDATLRLNIDQGRKFNHRIIVQDVRALEGIHYVEELG